MRHTKFKNRAIILASASARRRTLLKQIFTRFKIVIPGIKEEKRDLPQLSPPEYVQHLARLKAEAVATRLKTKDTLVVGADTIVYARGKIIGKPANKKDARRIMKELSGTRHSVITGVCVIDTRIGRSLSGYEESIVCMKRLSPKQIHKITSSSRHLDKAGGYAIQESGDRYIKLIKGSLSNAVGLPLRLVRQLTKRLLS